MKNQFKYLFSNLLLVALTGSMFAVAGCPADDVCSTDADCDEGQTCNTETESCEAPSGCLTDAECTVEGESCYGAAGDVRGACAVDCTKQADPDAFCDAAAAGEACDATTKTCELPAGPTDEIKYILILDTSSGDAACKSRAMNGTLSDPGADIYQAELSNAAGDDIGYGKLAKWVEGSSLTDPKNDLRNASTIFDGLPTSINTGSVCPAADGANGFFSANTSLALGCGGELYLSFSGTDSMSVAIANGQQLVIGEFTTACNDGISDGNDTPATASDVYSVFACKTEIGKDPSTLTAADCTIPLGSSLKGFQKLNVTAVD
jgi:hypothetical protein